MHTSRYIQVSQDHILCFWNFPPGCRYCLQFWIFLDRFLFRHYNGFKQVSLRGSWLLVDKNWKLTGGSLMYVSYTAAKFLSPPSPRVVITHLSLIQSGNKDVISRWHDILVIFLSLTLLFCCVFYPCKSIVFNIYFPCNVKNLAENMRDWHVYSVRLPVSKTSSQVKSQSCQIHKSSLLTEI